MSRAVLITYLVNFRKESINSGIGRFCRLEVSTDDQLAQFRFLVETGRTIRNRWTGPVSIFWSKQGELHETGHLFRIVLPVSTKKSKLGQLVIRWNSSLQNRPIPPDSSWKLSNSSLREQGTFFNVPGRKKPSKCRKILFCFWNENSRSKSIRFWECFGRCVNQNPNVKREVQAKNNGELQPTGRSKLSTHADNLALGNTNPPEQQAYTTTLQPREVIGPPMEVVARPTLTPRDQTLNYSGNELAASFSRASCSNILQFSSLWLAHR